jgi:hypothetical protein
MCAGSDPLSAHFTPETVRAATLAVFGLIDPLNDIRMMPQFASKLLYLAPLYEKYEHWSWSLASRDGLVRGSA